MGNWYHVSARGNERKAIYRREEDYRYWEGLLGQMGDRFGVDVHAYVQMPNHYHVLVELREAALS